MIYLVHIAFKKLIELSREIKFMPYFFFDLFPYNSYLFMKYFWSFCHGLH